MEGSSAVFGLGNPKYGVTGSGIVHHFDFLLVSAGSLVYGKTGAVAKGGGIGQLIDGGFRTVDFDIAVFFGAFCFGGIGSGMGGQAVIIGGFALISAEGGAAVRTQNHAYAVCVGNCFADGAGRTGGIGFHGNGIGVHMDAVPRAYVEGSVGGQGAASGQAAACVDFSCLNYGAVNICLADGPVGVQIAGTLSVRKRNDQIACFTGLSGIGAVCDNTVGPACQIGGGQGGNGAPGSQCPFKNHGVGRGNAVCYLPVYEFCVCQLPGIIIRVRCRSGRNAGKNRTVKHGGFGFICDISKPYLGFCGFMGISGICFVAV